MTSDHRALVAAVVMGIGGIYAGLSDHAGSFGLLKRWLMGAAMAAALIAGGVILGMAAYSAMCAGPWVCTSGP